MARVLLWGSSPLYKTFHVKQIAQILECPAVAPALLTPELLQAWMTRNDGGYRFLRDLPMFIMGYETPSLPYPWVKAGNSHERA